MHPIVTQQIKVQSIKLSELDGPAAGAESIETRLAEEDTSFQEKLRIRTDYLAERLGFQSAIEMLSARLKLVGMLACLVCVCLGFLAAGNAFDSQTNATVNFYWLILVLTGFNLLSMLVWIGAIVFGARANGNRLGFSDGGYGAMFTSVKWLMNRLIKSKYANVERCTLQAWIRVYNDSGLSRWALSRSSHLLWLSYLSGGLLMVLLMLSVREYNFGWATTILRPETFVDLTRLLAALPDTLGLVTPGREVIAASRLDTLLTVQNADGVQAVAAIRNSWATLLLSCLVLYGILPRLLLFVICHWQVKRAVLSYGPDYSEPYFLDLRHRLIPVTRSLGIIDPDVAPQSADKQNAGHGISSKLPEKVRYLTIELAKDAPWPPPSVDKNICLGDASDSQSQQEALAEVARLTSPLVCVVSLLRTPDRGIARYLKEVMEHCPTPVYLMIFGDFSADGKMLNQSAAGLRLGDWHRLATQLNLPNERLIHRQSHE